MNSESNDHFDLLLAEISGYLSPDQIQEITKAYHFAKKAHQGQKRSTGEDYITHPVAVARTLANLKLDPQSIMAALLHDVIEDTGVSHSAMAKEFGTPVANLVDGVSKLDRLKFKSRAEAQAESFRKMLISMASDIRVILVKLADRLHNMRTLDALPSEKQRRISQETLDIYAPIAHRLGMNYFRVTLEDLGFKAYYPMRARIIEQALVTVHGKRRKIIEKIEEKIKASLKAANIPVVYASGREKHLYSIYNKMKEKNISFSDVLDVYAFRIITQDIDTCYRILGIVHHLYKPMFGKFKDYIAIAKTNGYQSLHTILFGPHGIPIEIQIRTKEMHQNAEFGIAAHWRYKTPNTSITQAQATTQEWLKNLLDIQQHSKSSLEFIENVKTDLGSDDVFLFTPEGDILELPQGATPIDFAYALHTDLGHHCVAARVDKQLAPLSAPLKTGQSVNIITSDNARPHPSWLQFVITGKARSNIRHFLKTQHRNESISLGSRLVSHALNDLSLSLQKVPENVIDALLAEEHLKSIDDLFEQIGLGNQTALLVAQRIAHLAGVENSALDCQPTKSLAIKGTEGMAVRFATCCYPLPGDPICALILSGQGLIVHHSQCAQLTHSTKSEPIPVHWAKNIEGKFRTQLLIDSLDQPGILATLANEIADQQANIESIQSEHVLGGYARIILLLSVKDRLHLATVIKQLRKIKGIEKITRSRDTP